MSSALARSRKTKVGYELVCELLCRPLAHVVVAVLLPLRVPPPLVATASGATGIAAALALAEGRLLLAALLVQGKTVLDNADGQLARLSGRVTPLGRYLDAELDLFVNAALLAAVGWSTGRPVLAATGFVALTTVLNVNYNAERLYRAERGVEVSAMPETSGWADGFLRRLYLLLYAPQDRLVERFFARRLHTASPQARLAYHDRATVSVLANLGMSTQLAAFGICVALGRPDAFAWIALAEVLFVVSLLLRRELAIRRFSRPAKAPAWETPDRMSRPSGDSGAPATVISARAIEKRYGRKRALRPVDIELPERSVLLVTRGQWLRKDDVASAPRRPGRALEG